MIKPFALVIAAGLLAGCGSAPKAPAEAPGCAAQGLLPGRLAGGDHAGDQQAHRA